MTAVTSPYSSAGTPVERVGRRLTARADHLICSGTLNAIGQPALWIGHKEVAVHRWLWARVHGPIPAGYVLWNTCEQDRCVAPAHYEMLTRREAAARALDRRWGYSERCGRGHYFLPENIYWHKGYRYCKTCRRENAQALRARKKELAGG